MKTTPFFMRMGPKNATTASMFQSICIHLHSTRVAPLTTLEPPVSEAIFEIQTYI